MKPVERLQEYCSEIILAGFVVLYINKLEFWQILPKKLDIPKINKQFMDLFFPKFNLFCSEPRGKILTNF